MDQLREDRIRAMQSLREDPLHDVNSISFRSGGTSFSANHESDLRGYVASIPDGGSGVTRKRKRTASDAKRKTSAATAAANEKTKRRRMIIDKIDGSANLLDDRINENASHTSDAERADWIEQKSRKSKLILGSPHLAKIRLRDTRNSRIKRWQVNISSGCGSGMNDRWRNFMGLTRLLQRRYFSEDESYNPQHHGHADEDDFDDVFVPQEDLIRVGAMELVGGAPERPERVRLASSGEVVQTPGSSRRGFCSGWGIEHGKRVHEEVERMVLSYAEHGTVEPGITSMRREPDLCSLRFMKFMIDNNWRPLTCEYKMYHPLLGVATAADVVALDVVTLNIVFIELKTGGTSENFRSVRYTKNESTGEMRKRRMRAELDTVNDTPFNRAVVQCLVMMMMMQSNAEIMIANGVPITQETYPIPDEFYVVHVPSGREKPVRHEMPSWIYKKENRQLVFDGLYEEVQQRSIESVVYRGAGTSLRPVHVNETDREGDRDEDAEDVARSDEESQGKVSSPQSDSFSHDSLSDTSDSSDDTNDDDDPEESVLRILAF